ncbi:hypothetical protein D9758_013092 [Tetrapyrgos nigripes]|uniref:Uncharacterized protein n=1 Tax=Tetrapyrgos nigripes TaxID=182062 RepID=A0A8H5C9U0_9AGAR|nr:hypothetical protein D9758_013092 [Tetrapyrgos nigripes]
MIIGRVAYLQEQTGHCYIGLKFFSSYDLLITLFLTALFLWPLLRSTLDSPRIRTVALRTSVVRSGSCDVHRQCCGPCRPARQKSGWLCLACCTADIICNFLVLFWVTKDSLTNSSSHNTTSHGQIRNKDNNHNAPVVLMNASGAVSTVTATDRLQVKQESSRLSYSPKKLMFKLNDKDRGLEE